jgi:hypothetical protein
MRAVRVPRSLLAAMLVLSSIAVVPSIGGSQASKGIDLTGKWLFTVTTDAGTGTPTVTLKQQGDSLTGHYSSQLLGEAELKGTVKDSKLSFTFQTEVQGTAVVVSYTGTVESRDALKGSVDIGGAATGTFTAKRQ